MSADKSCDVDFLLALAGFDPAKIPEKRRLAAVFVSDYWRGGVFDIVCEVRDALRIAARPGVRTG